MEHGFDKSKGFGWTPRAWEEYTDWLQHDRKAVKKISDLIKDIQRNGLLQGIGEPEKLRYIEGAYSRRINKYDRLTYEVHNDMLVITSCKGHYEA